MASQLSTSGKLFNHWTLYSICFRASHVFDEILLYLYQIKSSSRQPNSQQSITNCQFSGRFTYNEELDILAGLEPGAFGCGWRPLTPSLVTIFLIGDRKL